MRDDREQYTRIYYRDKGKCRTCGTALRYGEGQRAHRIAQTKANRRKYGDAVIYHDENMVLTCPGRCNDAQNIGNNTVQSRALADLIRAGIYRLAIDKILAQPERYTKITDELAEVADGY